MGVVEVHVPHLNPSLMEDSDLTLPHLPRQSTPHQVRRVKQDLVHVFVELFVFLGVSQKVFAKLDFKVGPRARIARSSDHEFVALGPIDSPEMLAEDAVDLVEAV
jgi:hypothetical protein